MKVKKIILFLITLFLIIPFSSCNKNCEHEYVNKSFLVQPTCEETGKVLMKCKKCKAEQIVVLNALGHDYVYEVVNESTCFSYGYSRGVCRRDSTHTTTKLIEKLPHNFVNYVDDNNASLKQNATKTAKCENEGCNEVDIIEIKGTMLPDYNNDSFFYDLINNVLENNYTINLSNCRIVNDVLFTDNFSLSILFNKETNKYEGKGFYNNYVFTLYEDVLYVKEDGNKFHKISIKDVMVDDTSLSVILSMLDSTYLKAYNYINNYITKYSKVINRLSRNIIFEVFDIIKDDNGYMFTLNLDFLKDLNNKLRYMDVFEFSNKYLIGNIVNTLHSDVKEFLDKKVRDLLESDEYNIIEILDIIDELIVVLTDNKYQTLEQYLLSEMEIEIFDINDIFVNEKYQDYTVLDAISEISKIPSTTIMLAINTNFINFENKNIYEFIGSFVKLSARELHLLINDFIDTHNDKFSYNFYVTLDRNLLDVAISYGDSFTLNIIKNNNENNIDYELIELVNSNTK